MTNPTDSSKEIEIPERQKGNFVLDWNRSKVPTDDTMYDCDDCKKKGIPHEIKSHYEGVTGQHGPWPPDLPTTVRICTACGKYDGPWVSADLVGGGW